MAYQDVLNAAECLGFQLPGSHMDAVQSLEGAEQLVDDYKRLHELQQRLHTLQLYVDSRALTDHVQLQGRASSVQAAAGTLRATCSTKDALADRLRSAKTRPSVPVAPSYQPDFSALLVHSASSTGILQHGMMALRWAAALDAKPSCWEDQLKCILEAARDVGGCMAALEQFSQAVASAASEVNTPPDEADR